MKLFMNGRSQALRLPVAFRLEGDAVYVSRDPATGDLLLSQREAGWSELFRRVDACGVLPDFMAGREQDADQHRELF